MADERTGLAGPLLQSARRSNRDPCSAHRGLCIAHLFYTETGLAPSNGEARRLIKQGAVSIDGAKVTDIDFEVPLALPSVLKVGKRRFVKVVPKN